MRLLFVILIGLSAAFIACCSAYFSVRGLGLLFAGSALAVMVMAASLEIGKLVAASVLYQHWQRLSIPVRAYLMVAVLVLVGITSLGVYGYLARAYEGTNAQVALLQQQIDGLQRQQADIQQRIDAARNQTGKLTDADRQDIQNLQQQIAGSDKSLEGALSRLDAQRKAALDKRDKALDALHKQAITNGQTFDQSLARLDTRRKTTLDKRDQDLATYTTQLTTADKTLKDGLAAEDTQVGLLNDQVAALDRAVEAYTSKGTGGFFKDDGVRMGQELRERQKPQRDAIAAQIAQHRANQDSLRTGYKTEADALNVKMASVRELAAKDAAALDVEEQALRKSLADAGPAVSAQIAAAGQDYTRESAGIDQDEKTLRVSAAQATAALTQQLASLQNKGQSLVADGGNQVEALYQSLRTGDTQILQLRQQIAATDVGTYRFVARALNAPVDDVVKWLIFVIVLVFDPLAVALTIGFNVALAGYLRPRGRTFGVDASHEPSAGGGPGASRVHIDRRAVVAGSIILAVILVGVGGLALRAMARNAGDTARGRLVPNDAFAVVAFRPASLRQSSDPQAASSAAFRSPLAEAIGQMLASGFDTDADAFAFVKYPADKSRPTSDRPVMLCGLTAQVSDPAAAEASLSRFAQALAGLLGSQPAAAGPLAGSRVMVKCGQGKYLDPEGGFFTFGMTGRQAVMLIEIEGDPSRSCIEQEMQLCLRQADPDFSSSATTAAASRPRVLPAATGEGVALWFDAARCFADMPKSAAAQTRYQRLQRYLDFDMMLTIQPTAAGRLDIKGQYTYAGERFSAPDTTAIDVLAKLGPAESAGVSGRLMDRCADTLEFDSLIERLRTALAGPQTGSPRAQIVVQKTTGSLRDAHFELTAQYDPQAGSPLVEAFRSLWLF